MQDEQRRPIVFTATGAGYFRIWIVNLLLTIVTLGLYSAWAKVRRLRYFYGNTLVDGSPFDFHGEPVALLKGRLIGVVLLAAYSQAAKFSLWAWIAVALALLFLLPWLLWKSLRFRLGNSSYRGIPFGFDGTVGQAYAIFVPLMLAFSAPTVVPLLIAGEALVTKDPMRYVAIVYATFGSIVLLAPWFWTRLRAYQHGHARLGTVPFSFDGRTRTVYLILLKYVLIAIAVFLIAALAAGLVFGIVFAGSYFMHASKSTITFVGTAFAGAIFYLLIISSWSFARAMLQNFAWNHTTLGGHRFTSGVRLMRLWWIEFGNAALTVLTLGLFWPFAVVRSLRYRIESVSWDGDVDAFARAQADRPASATGEETADLFGIDLAL